MLFEQVIEAGQMQVQQECPDFHRAGGDCICPACGQAYWRHPQHWPFIWLRVLCSGEAVKL